MRTPEKFRRPAALSSTIASVIFAWGLLAGPAAAVALPKLVGLSVSPNPATVWLGDAVQLAAIGTFSDGSVADVSTQVRWSTSDAGVITFSTRGAAGLASAVGIGEAVITAKLRGVVGTASVRVHAHLLVSLWVNPSAAGIIRGETLLFEAVGTYPDGSTEVVPATWTTSDPAIVFVGDDGMALASAYGSATIAATFEGLTAQAQVDVWRGPSVSIDVTLPLDIWIGIPIPLDEPGREPLMVIYQDGSSSNLPAGAVVRWYSERPDAADVVWIDGRRYLVGLEPGVFQVLAEYDGWWGGHVGSVHGECCIAEDG